MPKIKLKRSEIPQVKAKLMKKQEGVCPLCLREFKDLEPTNIVLDHCHHSGFVRAVLCRNCNGREGEILSRAVRGSLGGDYVSWLRRLADYWELHQTPQTNYIHPTFKTPATVEAERRAKRAAAARLRRKQLKEGKK